MREIKFRAWDTKSKHMSHEQINPFDGDYLIEFEHINLDRSSKDLIWIQYTGLKDKNGKEIYEGDIVNYLEMNLTVAWSDTLARPILRPYTIAHHYDLNADVAEECEVIGNIYENPELMPKEEQ